ncbi:hypothetical protein A4D02_35510 [Niastella koreensis]|uniref:Uncharacterized protein n=1 Tax=Niastella koreensis TaxID=354356 RepID=A0ABX3NS02_9BACT|nr:hypothetical protein A4D02_35510 [Niastella koreensis]
MALVPRLSSIAFIIADEKVSLPIRTINFPLLFLAIIVVKIKDAVSRIVCVPVIVLHLVRKRPVFYNYQGRLSAFVPATDLMTRLIVLPSGEFKSKVVSFVLCVICKPFKITGLLINFPVMPEHPSYEHIFNGFKKIFQ